MSWARSRRRLLTWTVALAVVAGLAAVGLSGRGPTAQRLAPALPRARLAGPPATLAALRGRSAVVLFWASDCEPCQREARAVERFADSPAGRGRVVGVDYGVDPGARGFIGRYRWTFSNFADPDGRAGEAYGLRGLPTSFVIDARGRIAATLHGPQTVATLTRALATAD